MPNGCAWAAGASRTCVAATAVAARAIRIALRCMIVPPSVLQGLLPSQRTAQRAVVRQVVAQREDLGGVGLIARSVASGSAPTGTSRMVLPTAAARGEECRLYADRKAWVASLRPGPIGYRRGGVLCRRRGGRARHARSAPGRP